MSRPYSLDLRERVVASVGEGQSRRAVAAVFKVGVATVVRWSQRSRATGSAAAKPMGGKRPYLLEGEREWLLGRLAEKPDLTLHALLAELRERSVMVSCDTLWRFLRRQGISFKNVWPAPLQMICREHHDRSASTYPASGLDPGQDGDTRVPVLIKLAASGAIF